MVNKREWGEKFRELRKGTGLSLAGLAAEFSRFHVQLSEKEIAALAAINVETYISLDGSAIFHYENGNRKLPDRERLLFFIYYFRKQGVLDLENANDWLKLAGLQPLYPYESQSLFSEKAKQGSSQESVDGLEPTQSISTRENLGDAAPERKVIYLPKSVTHVSIDTAQFPNLKEVLIVFISVLLIGLVVTGWIASRRKFLIGKLPPSSPEIAIGMVVTSTLTTGNPTTVINAPSSTAPANGKAAEADEARQKILVIAATLTAMAKVTPMPTTNLTPSPTLEVIVAPTLSSTLEVLISTLVPTPPAVRLTTAPTLVPTLIPIAPLATVIFTSTPISVDSCTTAQVLDTFNRADGGLGSNWAGLTDPGFYRIAGNRIGVQRGGAIVWNSTSFGTTQAAFVTFSAIDPSSSAQGLLLKVQPGDIPNAGAIAVVYDALAHAVHVSTWRSNMANWMPYGNIPVTFINGDKFGACVDANGKVRIYKNNALLISVTLNATDEAFFHVKGGKIGLWTSAAPHAFFDDFGGGTVRDVTAEEPVSP